MPGCPRTAAHLAWQGRATHAGGVLVLMVIALLALAGTALVLQQARQASQAVARSHDTQQRLGRADQALARFAALHGRLPCPADGAQASGLAQPPQAAPAPSYRCAAPQGTLPWKTLGLSADDALDAWGRKLSYRASDGVDGVVRDQSLRRASTAGLALDDRGRVQADQAWVLISHGASGLGAWLPGGTQRAAPAPGGDEARNLQAAPAAFVQRDEQVLGLDPASASAHFDDLLLARPMREADAGFGLLRLDDRRLARPGPLLFQGRDAGTATLSLQRGRDGGMVTLQAGGGHLARDAEAAGRAIGVCSGACDSDATSLLGGGQSLSLRLPSGDQQQLALAVWSPGPTVQASVTLRRAGAPLPGGTLALPSRPAGASRPTVWTQLAASPPAPFDEIVLSTAAGARFFHGHVRLCQGAEACE